MAKYMYQGNFLASFVLLIFGISYTWEILNAEHLDEDIMHLSEALFSILTHQNISRVILVSETNTSQREDLWDLIITYLSSQDSYISYEIRSQYQLGCYENQFCSKNNSYISAANAPIETGNHNLAIVYNRLAYNNNCIAFQASSYFIQSSVFTTVILCDELHVSSYRNDMEKGNKAILLAVNGTLKPRSSTCYYDLRQSFCFQDCRFNSHVLDTQKNQSFTLFETNYNFYILSLEDEQLEKVGSWNTSSGLDISKHKLWQINKFRIKKVFTIVSTPLPTFHYKVGNGSWTGVCIELLERVAARLNFSYVIVEPPDNKWGAIDNSGNWNGMIGMLHRREVDIGLGKFTILIQRDQVVDFTIPFFQEPVAMMMKKQYVTSSPVYVSPYKPEVWIYMLLSIVLMAFVLFIFALIKCRMVITERVKWKDIALKLKWGEILCITIGLLFNQDMIGINFFNGTRKNREKINKAIWSSCSIRLLITSWLIFGVIYLSIYTANLTAFLTVHKLNKPIKSLDHLLSQDTYKLGVLDSAALHLAMKTSKGGITAQLWEHSGKFEENRAESPTKGAEMTKQRPYVFLIETSWALNYVYNNCDVTLGDYFPFHSLYGFAFQENSPYLNDFNRILLQLLDEGWVKYYYDRHKGEDKCMTRNIRVSHESIKLQKQQRMFIVFSGFLAAGLCIAVLLEMCFKLIPKVGFAKCTPVVSIANTE